VPALSLDQAVDLTRTGDVWVFRGASVADRAIQAVTNAPVNHVGMAVVLEDLPPLLWHAELGRSLPDVWTGERQRGERGQPGWRYRLWASYDAAQGWIVVTIIGAAIGLNAAFLNIVTEWLSDIKMGYCTTAFYLNENFCCWGEDNGETKPQVLLLRTAS